MALIELTAEQRNGVPFAKTILVNTDTIAVPIREVGGKSYIGVNESILDGRPSERIDIVYYLVTESLSTVVGLSYALFRATVTTRDGRTPATGYTDLIFRLDRVVGNVIAEGSGSKFLYHEDNGSDPVTFIVSQAPSAIVSQVVPIPPTPVENPILKKTFNLNATDISTNLPMMLELDITDDCLITSVIFDFNVNGGAGIDYGGFGVIKLANSFTFSGTTIDAYQQLQTSNNVLISNEYQLTIDSFISVDPLTTLTIDIYYILK